MVDMTASVISTDNNMTWNAISGKFSNPWSGYLTRFSQIKSRQVATISPS
jgi:hypothetical protein